MNRRTFLAFVLASTLVALVPIGCRSVKVSDRDRYEGGKLPRPGRILVHDFAATLEDLPVWAEARQRYDDTGERPSEEILAVGRKLGLEVGRALVEDLSALGLPALRATGQPVPRLNDLVVVGAFTSVDAGSTVERVVIGFGSGNAELRTHVAVYRMSGTGLVKLGSGTLDPKGGSGPGLLVPVLVTVATANPIGLAVGGAAKLVGEVSGRDTIEGSARETADKIMTELRPRLEEQGWI